MLLPPIIDLVNREIENSNLRFLVSAIICLIAGSFTYYYLGDRMGIEAWAQEVLSVFGLAQISYKTAYDLPKLSLKEVVRGSEEQ